MENRVLEEQIREIIEPTVMRLGFDLVAVEMVGGQGKPTLRVSIDHPGGIGGDECALVSERISPELDEKDPIDGAYYLEVSSPGIERPVQRVSDFQRFVGYRVRMRNGAGAPRRRCTGTISQVAGEPPVVTVLVDGQEIAIPFDTIDRAHLVLTLEEYQKLAEDPRHDE